MSKLPSTRQSRSKKKRQLSCIVKPSVIAKIYILSSKNLLKKKFPKTIRYSPIQEMSIAVERVRSRKREGLGHGNVRIAQPLAFFIVQRL